MAEHTKTWSILFLDDEQMLIDLAIRFLGRLGYRVSGFTSATAAIEAFRRAPRQFDWVVTDMNMPEKTGLEVARDLKAIQLDIPIVLCSGATSEELQESARLVGIRAVLFKPTRMAELCDALHRCFAE